MNSQRALLHQTATDALAADLNTFLDDVRVFYGRLMNDLLIEFGPDPLAKDFDRIVRGRWEQARIGCAVAEDGRLLSPNPESADPVVQDFLGKTGFFSPTRPRPRCISRLNPRQTGSWSRMPDRIWPPKKTELPGRGNLPGRKRRRSSKRPLTFRFGEKSRWRKTSCGALSRWRGTMPRRPRLWIWRENRVFRRMTRRLPRSPRREISCSLKRCPSRLARRTGRMPSRRGKAATAKSPRWDNSAPAT